MKYFVRYGLNNDSIDITSTIMEKLIKDRYYEIPKLDDVTRGRTYGDPKYGVEKCIYLTSDEGHLFVIKNSEFAYIDTQDEILYLNEKPDDIE